MASRVRFTSRGRAVFGAFGVGLGLGLAISLQGAMVAFAAEGPNPGERIGQPDVDGLEFRAEATRPGRLEGARLLLGDRDVTDQIAVDGDSLVYRPERLADGEYTVTLEVERAVLPGIHRHQWAFTVDTVSPALVVTEPVEEVDPEESVTIAGTVDADSSLTADGTAVEIGDDGAFSVTFDQPPADPVFLEAVDPLGNRTEEEFVVPVAKSRPDQVRAVHMTAYSWMTPSLRDPVLQMVKEGKINTVELDLKDESGDIGYASQIPLAQEIGSAKGIYDLEEAVAQLHDLGVHVIGRIVAFRDPILGNAMWERGQQDLVLQTPGGERYAGYGGFTNFAHPEVRQYNIDIAMEAAEAGIDDILYDYIRRPDGALENLVIPGLGGSCEEPADPAGCTPEESVVAFLADSDRQLERYRVWLGASVYGIASDRPTEIAQDIPAMAEYADYIAPMVYPSHWGPGEYDVADPNNQPYDIVSRSVKDFVDLVEGTETRIIPWLQDFSLGVTYGPAQVRAQIDGTADAGAPEWILWSAAVRYTSEALDPH